MVDADPDSQDHLCRDQEEVDTEPGHEEVRFWSAVISSIID